MTTSEQENGILINGSDSFQLAQALYHTVTGKTESVSKRFTDNYKITFEDIQQLHAKCEQMCTQWTVIEKNENITLYHIDDNKEVFSSLERLKFYDKSQTSPIESISFEFNMLLQLPNIKKPQPYKIVVRLTSRIALLRKRETEGTNRLLLKLFRDGVVNIDIEYVDYVVARNMISTIDSWVKEIEVEKNSKLLRYAHRYSHWIPMVSSVLLFIFATMSAIYLVDTFITNTSESSLTIKYLIASFGFISISFFVGFWFGKIAEFSIDIVEEISYIEINKGDKKLLNQFKKRNYISLLKVSATFIFITAHAILSSYIGTLIFDTLK